MLSRPRARTPLSSSSPDQVTLASDSAPELIETEATSFGHSIPSWPVFLDAVDALRRLSSTYKLVVLSDVDRQSFSGTEKALSYTDTSSGELKSPFSLILTAQDVGVYKPSALGFERALKEIGELFGLKEGEDMKDYVLVVAQSLYHDHRPANKIGLHEGAWIDREDAIMGWEGCGGDEVGVEVYDVGGDGG